MYVKLTNQILLLELLQVIYVLVVTSLTLGR